MPVVVAHRGIRSRYPENTVVAIQAALDSSLYGVEFDVELTSDDAPVVVHQETVAPDKLGRLSHADRNPENRWVNDATLSYVSSLDAGSWLSSEFAGVRIPKLSEILELDWHTVTPFIELKDPFFWNGRNPTYEKRLLTATLPLLKKSASYNAGSVRLLSFNEHLLFSARELGFTGKIVLNVWRDRAHQLNEVIALAKSLNASVVDVAEDMALNEPRWITEAEKAGLELYTYEVSPARNESEFTRWTLAERIPYWRKLVSIGVSGIISDFAIDLLHWKENPAEVERMVNA